ncbi:MAG: DegT/DnrJ/EryC1/StrS family aminotransferase [bacterium]
MKSITTTFFSPLDKDQTMDCLKFLLLPWKWGSWKQGKYIKEAEDEMKNYLNKTPQSLIGDCGEERVKEVFSFYNGRAALYYALKAAGAGKGDEVIIQAYTCVTVPNAVLETGAHPIYCDVDESLNLDIEELKKKITVKTKAVIVQHTFGNPARIEEIKEICEYPPLPPLVKGGGAEVPPFSKGGNNGKIVLIEDCAHSLGAKYNGKLLGTFGDISMFSFGRDKVISSVNGGMLCINNEALVHSEIEEARDVSHGILSPPGARSQDDAVFPPITLIARNLMYPIIAQISLKWYNKLNIGKGIMDLSKKLKLFPLILSKEEKDGTAGLDKIYKMPNVLAYLFLQQFKKLDEYNAHRYEIAKYYDGILQKTEFRLPKVWDKSEPVYLRYVFFTEKAVEIMSAAKKKNIYLGDWYRQAIAPRGVNFKAISYEQNMCSKAERYSEMTLNLPNHYGIGMKEAGKVIEEIEKLGN